MKQSQATRKNYQGGVDPQIKYLQKLTPEQKARDIRRLRIEAHQTERQMAKELGEVWQ